MSPLDDVGTTSFLLMSRRLADDLQSSVSMDDAIPTLREAGPTTKARLLVDGLLLRFIKDDTFKIFTDDSLPTLIEAGPTTRVRLLVDDLLVPLFKDDTVPTHIWNDNLEVFRRDDTLPTTTRSRLPLDDFPRLHDRDDPRPTRLLHDRMPARNRDDPRPTHLLHDHTPSRNRDDTLPTCKRNDDDFLTTNKWLQQDFRTTTFDVLTTGELHGNDPRKTTRTPNDVCSTHHLRLKTSLTDLILQVTHPLQDLQ